MAVKIARFTTWQPESIELHDGKVYPCRQISAGGMDLLRIVTGKGDEGEEVSRAELVAEVVSLLGAPVAEVKRCSIEELISVLVSSAMPAEKMQEALSEAAPAKKKAMMPPRTRR